MSKKKNYKECITTPFETGIRNFTIIAKYFLYYAPNIDSAHSVGEINIDSASDIFDSLLKVDHIKKRTKTLKRIQPASWKSYDLDTEILDFEISRMTFDVYKNEDELHALLRHIRNSLAHGHLYVWRKKRGDFIFLVDYDSKKNKETAKLMLSKNILEEWKAILENEIAIGE